MFAVERAKVRAVAIVMAGVAVVQMWPGAYAQERPKATMAKDIEIKAPKKTKKRGNGHAPVSHSSPWRLSTMVRRVGEVPSPQVEADPVEVALKVAYEQLGKPYRWASAGPNAFDCSGFTSYVWKKAGVALPRTSSGQAAALERVPLGEMKPGDLIFSSGHVGMYVGKGKMIHSPQSGRTVSVDPVHSNAFAAGRPTA